MSIAVVFPGQGSQEPGMGSELFGTRTEAREVYDRVSKSTGVNVKELCQQTTEEVLRKTDNAQLALFTVSVAAFKCLQSHLQGHVRFDALAGHSVGEYAAVVASGALSIEEGALLVAKRGALMAQAGLENPGTMAAILGLDRKELEGVLSKIKGVVVIANDNCPGQLVISGEEKAVQEAIELAIQAGAKRAIPLNVSGAFHSPLMEDAATKLFQGFENLKFESTNQTGPVYSNVTAEAVGRVDEFPDLLQMGLRSPVRWTESVQNMIRDGVTTFIECGCGSVLSGLIKRIDRDVTCYRVNDMDTLEQTVGNVRM